MKDTERSPLGYYTIGIAALFLAGFLLLVVLGAHSYRNTVAVQDGNMQTRALLSYLATIVKGNESAGSVTVAEGESGQVLTVADGDSGYAFRLYLQEGQLVEDYAAIDAPLDPTAGQIIGTTNTFAIEKDGARLTIETDAGRAFVYLRGEGEAP